LGEVVEVIWDAVTFWNEIDVFELRLRLLDDTVDRFIVVEGDKTFRGKDNRYSLEMWRDRLEPWWDRIVLHREVLPSHSNPWVLESAQRAAIGTVAAGLLSDDDVLVFGDADEIWQPNLLDGLTGPRIAQMDFRVMSVYWRRNDTVLCSIAGHWRDLKGENLHSLRMGKRQELPRVRSGWQFSWMGQPDRMREKAAAFSHTEYDGADFERLSSEGRWIDRPFDIVEDGLPEFVAQGGMPPDWYRR